MIYLDAGATTLQKPERVRRAMYDAVAAMSSPGRGSYPATRLAEETDFQCRSLAAELFGVDDPARVVFTANATHGLNIAIKTLVKPGSRVVISGYEHNAVTRPLHGIPDVELTVVDTPLFRPEAMLAEFEQALDAGAEDMKVDDDAHEIYTAPNDFSTVREALEKQGVTFLAAEVDKIPQNTVALPDEETIQKIRKLLEMLEDNDDVQNVWHNWDQE